jgi:NAD(P)-dependent dehydrogenase (short-subunit alcohol dehydrogenase family)
MDLQLTGKRAVVSGGSRGIGLAIADALAAEGADIAVVARNAEALAEAQRSLSRHGGRVIAKAADTGDDASVRQSIAEIVAELGGVDILVNTAAQAAGGPGAPPKLAGLDDADLRREIEIKVLGYLRMARAVAPHMIEQGWGRIINVSGLAARSTGSTFGTIRNVAVAAMTKNLSDELAPQGVNVTVVHPGTTVTERMPSLLEALAQAQGVTPAEAEARLAKGASIGRLVTAAEVANVVAFLASPRSAAITGDAIAVGGGVPGPIYY